MVLRRVCSVTIKELRRECWILINLPSKVHTVRTLKLSKDSINYPSVYHFAYLSFASRSLHLISIVKSQTYNYQTTLRKKIQGKHPTDIPNSAAGAHAHIPPLLGWFQFCCPTGIPSLFWPWPGAGGADEQRGSGWRRNENGLGHGVHCHWISKILTELKPPAQRTSQKYKAQYYSRYRLKYFIQGNPGSWPREGKKVMLPTKLIFLTLE